MEMGQYPHPLYREPTEKARGGPVMPKVTEQSGAKVGLKSRPAWLQSGVPHPCAQSGPLRPCLLLPTLLKILMELPPIPPIS